jgi:hypothetical protein
LSSSAGLAAAGTGDKTFALQQCFHCVDVSAMCENECMKGDVNWWAHYFFSKQVGTICIIETVNEQRYFG